MAISEFSVKKTINLDYQSILESLVMEGVIGRESAENVLAQPKSREDLSKHPFLFLANCGIPLKPSPDKTLKSLHCCEWLAKESGIPFYPINPLKIDAAKVTEVMSFAFAKQHSILAVEVHPDHVLVATTQPYKTGWIENLTHVLNKRIELVIGDPEDLERLTTEFYALARSISGASEGAQHHSPQIEAFLQLGQVKEPDASDQNIVTIVDWLFQYAFEQRASDIHIEPRKTQGYIRFRIDGALHQVYDMPIKPLVAVTSRIKTMGRMNIAEKRKPQDGRLKTKTPNGQEVDLRLSTIPTAFGEKLVIRIFDPNVLLKSFEELGLMNQDLERWQGMITKPHGIVLVTGPTGSGKTTTLYSTLKGLAQPEVNVCTIEDPIEMVEDTFNQMQVNHGIDLDFADGVRALLRQDPDIMMIGEIRDQETAQMAVQAALTGHLVLSTLHTNDATLAITRLLEIGLPAYLVRATLNGVMAQRLVRVLCPDCKKPGEVSPALWDALTKPFNVPMPKKVFEPVGCLSCRQTGFKGRIGVYEILDVNETIGQMIQSQTDLMGVRKQAIKDGMRTLRLSGAQKVMSGMTTCEEVLRVAPAAFHS
jgi:general secretion pathway protein E